MGILQKNKRTQTRPTQRVRGQLSLIYRFFWCEQITLCVCVPLIANKSQQTAILLRHLNSPCARVSVGTTLKKMLRSISRWTYGRGRGLNCAVLCVCFSSDFACLFRSPLPPTNLQSVTRHCLFSKTPDRASPISRQAQTNCAVIR